MAPDFPEEERLKQKNKIINEVLKSKYQVKLKSFLVKEDFENSKSTVICVVGSGFSGELVDVNLEGTGTGAIDALFKMLLKEYSKYFSSLERVKLYDFLVKVKFQSSSRDTGAPVEVKVAIEGINNNNKLYFKETSDSLVRAGVGATCKTLEYLINAELAVRHLYEDILDARERNRGDLIKSYTNNLIELTDFISYEETIDFIKKKK